MSQKQIKAPKKSFVISGDVQRKNYPHTVTLLLNKDLLAKT